MAIFGGAGACVIATSWAVVGPPMALRMAMEPMICGLAGFEISTIWRPAVPALSSVSTLRRVSRAWHSARSAAASWRGEIPR